MTDGIPGEISRRMTEWKYSAAQKVSIIAS